MSQIPKRPTYQLPGLHKIKDTAKSLHTQGEIDYKLPINPGKNESAI
jgi:hypothetical protein